MFEITLFFLFSIDNVQQVAKCCRKRICLVWAKYTLYARIHKNIKKITNIRVLTEFTFLHVLPPASNTSRHRWCTDSQQRLLVEFRIFSCRL